jgi:sugar phosphate isomerase/epimerase
MDRRAFLQTSAGVALTPAAPATVPRRDLPLGVDTYSLRSQRWRVPRMLEFAAAQKLDVIQSSSADFESTGEDYLLSMKEQANRYGILLEPGFGCISPVSKGYNATRQGDPVKYLQNCIRITKTLGATAFKVFLGNASDRQGDTSIASLMESGIQAIRAVRTVAADARIKIAIENHGDLQARELRTVIEEAGRDVTACNFDSGNPPVVAEDPIAALEILAPYIVTSHIRDSAVYENATGASVQWVAMGDGSVNLDRFAQRFAELCPKASFQLEILTGMPARLLPYLEPAYWDRFPNANASDFARFVALARSGRPYAGPMIMADTRGKIPEEYRAALRIQERIDLERSLDYCRKTLNIGRGWRT